MQGIVLTVRKRGEIGGSYPPCPPAYGVFLSRLTVSNETTSTMKIDWSDKALSFTVRSKVTLTLQVCILREVIGKV